MGKSIIVNSSVLDNTVVLAPERYDARRNSATSLNTIQSLMHIINVHIGPTSKGGEEKVLVLDTNNAYEGMVLINKLPQTIHDLGSQKKLIRPGDVILSRLRPYLRQIAYIDNGLVLQADIKLACSTEFYVLRSRNEESIAFVVPYLLSSSVQEILCACQEGGHHPRFIQTVLENLPISQEMIDRRSLISQQVEDAIDSIRGGVNTLRCLGQ